MRPTLNQIDDLLEEIRKVAERDERVLVTTLTKKMAEDLSRYLKDVGIKVNYIHSEFDVPARFGSTKETVCTPNRR